MKYDQSKNKHTYITEFDQADPVIRRRAGEYYSFGVCFIKPLYCGRDLLSLILALLIWSVGIIASKLTAKIDPWATKVFLRSLLYRDFYHAREKINTPNAF